MTTIAPVSVGATAPSRPASTPSALAPELSAAAQNLKETKTEALRLPNLTFGYVFRDAATGEVKGRWPLQGAAPAPLGQKASRTA
ncbi:MAG: hypothetical protein AB7M12_11890 [Hyphomonadaceae bacterium]